ncbi:zinc finger CCHC domain-containing protein 7 [Astyanax mexicanus]|uniref:zinc finger CCHC domain-containing protein 7 n=1 Tax=Astyanax mexicanus TaxID=7994 RepID=UPI0020CAF25F|nr:zinc finger CCHC domain-containing protein 7 [Astyanax mexicanus]
MFSGYQEREEYEDELYRVEDEEDCSLSELDSELEFQLYSQLHYGAEDQNNQENRDKQQGNADSGSVHTKVPQSMPGKEPTPLSPPEIITIDSGPDVILISDNTETEDSVCAIKGRSASTKKQRHTASSCPPLRKTPENEAGEVVVVELESDESSDSDSVPPFVADLDSVSDSNSDSDGLENWMLLGKGKEAGDQNIQLNLAVEENEEQEDFVRHEGGPQNWTVSDRDKEAQIFNKGQGGVRLANRYYSPKTVTCHNCRRVGHLSKNCPSQKKLPCCSLCGVQGHFVRACPSRHCSNCFLPGHTYDDCLERAYWQKCCHRCGMTGHYIDLCPDIWRQYHITTRVGPPVKVPNLKATSPAYCYNCSKRGHFGHECTQKRMFNGTYPTLPFVSGYNTQCDLRYLENRARNYVQELQRAGLLEQQEEEEAPPQTPQPPRKKQKPNPNKNTLFPFTPTGRPPKRRIAHTPKHHPQTTPKQSAWKPAQKNTPVPQLEGKKKKNKKNNKSAFIVDVDEDFPRGFQKSPHSRGTCTPSSAGKPFRSGGLFGSGRSSSEKSNKKKNRMKKWERKAANDLKNQPSDENLFLIKQRKRSR